MYIYDLSPYEMILIYLYHIDT